MCVCNVGSAASIRLMLLTSECEICALHGIVVPGLKGHVFLFFGCNITLNFEKFWG